MIFMQKKEEDNKEQTNVVQDTTPVQNTISDDELKKLKDNIIDLENKLKYSQAELINYRKRKSCSR